MLGRILLRFKSCSDGDGLNLLFKEGKKLHTDHLAQKGWERQNLCQKDCLLLKTSSVNLCQQHQRQIECDQFLPMFSDYVT